MNAVELRQRLHGLIHVPLPADTLRPAAVLVALEPDRGVWLTRRSSALPDHAGQVAFPGGKIDVRDVSVEAAALREAEEEIGLKPEQAEILGRMDDFVTGSGFHIRPVVALVPAGIRFTAAAAEVQDIFFLPFEVLLDRDAPKQRSVVTRGSLRIFWAWPHDEHLIWGATAAILRDLARRLA